jgi:hypothetical protein
LKELNNDLIGLSIKKQIEDAAAQNNTNPNQPLLDVHKHKVNGMIILPFFRAYPSN